jgi:hypothetical protein
VNPEIDDVVKKDIRKDGADYSPNAKGNFTFDRVICGWRGGLTMLDLRLKR